MSTDLSTVRTVEQLITMLPTFGASGANSRRGLVPDPGPIASNNVVRRVLTEDGVWLGPGQASGFTAASNKQVIFNDAGVFAGDPNFTWDKAIQTIRISSTFLSAPTAGGVDTSLSNNLYNNAGWKYGPTGGAGAGVLMYVATGALSIYTAPVTADPPDAAATITPILNILRSATGVPLLGFGAAPTPIEPAVSNAVFQLGQSTIIFNHATFGFSFYCNNLYYNAGWKYLGNAGGEYYCQDPAGAHYWAVAPVNAGGAGVVAPVVNAMSLDVAGNLSLGTFEKFSGVAATHSELCDHGVSTELVTLSLVSSITTSATNLLPANSIIDAVLVRVTVAITGAGITGATATDVASGMSDRFVSSTGPGGALATALGSTKIGRCQWVGFGGANGPIQVTADKARIQLIGGTATAGQVRITVYYRTFTAPTS